jgi:hypothetical protein
MFKDKLSLADVAIELDIDTDIVSYYKDVISIYVSMANAIDSRIEHKFWLSPPFATAISISIVNYLQG